MSGFKQPNRGSSRISQTYNDGYVRIYRESDSAAPGRQPVPELTLLIKQPYEERQLGIRRYYEAKQNQMTIQRVLRVQRTSVAISSQDVALTEDGKRYRIDLVQSMQNVYPPSLDLTLVAYSQGVQT